MSKLAKWKGAIKRNAVKVAGNEGIGKTGHKIVTLGAHAGLALMSKNVDSLGPIPVRPDVAGLSASLLGMMVLKGKGRKLAQSCAEGAAHALITRWINNGNLTIINGPIAGSEEAA